MADEKMVTATTQGGPFAGLSWTVPDETPLRLRVEKDGLVLIYVERERRGDNVTVAVI